MSEWMFLEIIKDTDRREFIIEINSYQLSRVFHQLVSSIHTELISLDFLMVMGCQQIIVGNNLYEIVLTDFVVFFGLCFEFGMIIWIVVQM